MTVNKERVELWAQALESERYVQCRGSLALNPPGAGMRPGKRHCALGVGMAVAAAHGVGISWREWIGATFSQRVMDWYGFDRANPILILDDRKPTTVVTTNDILGFPFWDIAQAIRTTYLKDES